MLFLLVLCKQSRSAEHEFHVLVWEFERDRRAESDGGQRTESSSPDIRAIFVCRNSEVVLLPWRQLVFSI